MVHPSIVRASSDGLPCNIALHMEPLEKVKEAAIWLERHRNLEEAGKLRLAKAIRLAAWKGESVSEIARQASVSRPTVYRILNS